MRELFNVALEFTRVRGVPVRLCRFQVSGTGIRVHRAKGPGCKVQDPFRIGLETRPVQIPTWPHVIPCEEARYHQTHREVMHSARCEGRETGRYTLTIRTPRRRQATTPTTNSNPNLSHGSGLSIQCALCKVQGADSNGSGLGQRCGAEMGSGCRIYG